MSKSISPSGVYDNALARFLKESEPVRKRLRNQVSTKPEGGLKVNDVLVVGIQELREVNVVLWNILLHSGQVRKAEEFYIFLALSDSLKGSSLNEFWMFSMTQMSDEHFRKMIDEELYWNSSDIFGNILRGENISTTLRNFQCYWYSQPDAVETQFIRGYRDKGSLRLPHEFHSFVETSWNEVDYPRRLYNLQMLSLRLVELLIDEGSAEELQDFVKRTKTIPKEEIVNEQQYKDRISSIQKEIERRTDQGTKE